MPIASPRSLSSLEAVQSEQSGVHAIESLTAAEPPILTELDEVWDEPTVPDVPSLLPAAPTRSQQMRAVRPPPEPAPARQPEAHVSGHMLDAELLFANDAEILLELQQSPARAAVQPVAAPVPVAPEPTPAVREEKKPDPRPGIMAFAGYGIAPEGVAGSAAYALRVLSRQIQLRDDLRIARMRRNPDVGLYEAALRCADESAVTRGVAVIMASTVGMLGAILAAAAVFL